MARFTPVLSFLLVFTVCWAGGGLWGCQQRSQIAQFLPAPSLDAPRMMPAAPVKSAAAPVPRASARTEQATVSVSVAANASVAPSDAQKSAPSTGSGQAPQPGIPTEWVPTVPLRAWQWIVIHHTATTFGNAQIIDGWHRDRGFDELGYHFVIGNGTNSGDGQIEVGPRWTEQKWGAHTKTADNRFNDYGIGICLVGNFDEQHPTAAQLHAVTTLVAYLMKTYHVPPDRILGHGDAKPTDCPGRFLSVADVRQSAVQMLAAQGILPEHNTLAANRELLLPAASK